MKGSFTCCQGYRTKALQVIRKGFTLGALPTSELHRQYLSLHAPEKVKADVGTAGRSHLGGSPLGVEQRESMARKQELSATPRATASFSSITGSSSDSGTQETVTYVSQASSAVAKEEINGQLEPFSQKSRNPRLRSVLLGTAGQYFLIFWLKCCVC